jgi:hypothetical protein
MSRRFGGTSVHIRSTRRLSQKMSNFITTAVRTSNPTYCLYLFPSDVFISYVFQFLLSHICSLKKYSGHEKSDLKVMINVYVRYEVFTAVTMKNAVFWDVAPYRSCVNIRFGGTYRLHLQGRKIRERGTSVSRWLQSYGTFYKST